MWRINAFAAAACAFAAVFSTNSQDAWFLSATNSFLAVLNLIYAIEGIVRRAVND